MVVRFSVSIHAPRTGRDLCQGMIVCICHCFNPRAPYGARLLHVLARHAPDAVSIHAPRTGRDLICSLSRRCSIGFNPRAPYGARLDPDEDRTTKGKFQSTRPVRGATVTDAYSVILDNVSIHAPRTGRDTPARGPFHANPNLQTTRPVGGATSSWAWTTSVSTFQSTRPVRGATSCSNQS